MYLMTREHQGHMTKSNRFLKSRQAMVPTEFIKHSGEVDLELTVAFVQVPSFKRQLNHLK